PRARGSAACIRTRSRKRRWPPWSIWRAVTASRCGPQWSLSNGPQGYEEKRRIRRNVFSPALEVILTVAYREAAARRHTHLTLEHLLYALAHDPDGDRIPAPCGAALPQLRRDLDKYLDEHIEQFSRGQQKEPEQTMAFRRVLQTAVLHVQSAGRQEVQSGDVLAATLQQSKSYAAQLLAGQGVSRLDVLEYITNGLCKVPPSSSGSASDADAAP